MAQYQGVSGVARRISRRYQGVSGVARQVKKAYVGVRGVARLYFAAGVPWRKWSCDAGSDAVYTRTDRGVGVTDTFQVTADSVWWMSFGSYSFDSDSGFQGDYGDYIHAAPDTITGRYSVVDTELRQWIRCDDNGDGTYTLVWEVIGTAEEDRWDTYRKGGTDYGLVYAPEGEQPEAGSLLEGTPTGSYCVIQADDACCYYYEKEEE